MSRLKDVRAVSGRQLRLWPGVAVAILQLLLWLVLPMIVPEANGLALIGGIFGALLILAWWLFLSRAPRLERWGAVLLIAIAVVLGPHFVDKSIATGMMGMMFPIYAIPVLSLALAAWAWGSRRLAAGSRRASLVLTLLAACGLFACLRTDGITGEGRSQFTWRWTKTPEQLLLAQAEIRPTKVPAAVLMTAEEAPASHPRPSPEAPGSQPPADAVESPGEPSPGPDATANKSLSTEDWPGFRGPLRDGIVPAVKIKTDWVSSPPTLLWRRPVGPGWSSFAVQDGLVFTQEQRGDSEVVAAYDVSSGEPVWTHTDGARFWESNGGAGPRGTPTLHGGRVYSLGATGILNALDSRDGLLEWSRNAASDAGVKTPGWGFSSSPLVMDDIVIVAVSGRLVGYDRSTGSPLWLGEDRGTSYSSPHLIPIDGEWQVVLLNGSGATSVAPADGGVLWEYRWPGAAMLQPALTSDGGILVTTGDMSGGAGMRRLSVTRGSDGWAVQEDWKSTGLKPYFNDFVVRDGHAFGFDGSILACIDLRDGKRKWKGGRYGHGQMLLLSEQNVLLILSEEGELALVDATPAQFTEIARVPAIEGKTWNHPVLAGYTLLVRNGQEMAAFRLTPEEGE